MVVSSAAQRGEYIQYKIIETGTQNRACGSFPQLPTSVEAELKYKVGTYINFKSYEGTSTLVAAKGKYPLQKCNRVK